MKFYASLTFILLFAACSTTEKTDTGKDTTDTTANTPVDRTNCDSLYFVDEELYDHFFGFQPSLKNFRKELPATFEHQKEVFRNIHIEGQVDTIDHIISGQDEVKIYRMPDRDLFFEASIRSNTLLKSSGFKIGMTRAEFWNSMGIAPAACDSVVFGSEERTFTFSFVFKDSVLNRVWFDGYLE